MELLIDGVKQNIDPAPMCSRCKSFSYILTHNKKGALICHRCTHRRDVHKRDMPDPVVEKLRGQSPAEWDN